MDSSEEGAADLKILKLFLLAPISVSVTQTSTLDSQPLVSSVPAVTQSSVSVSQSLPPVTQHCAYLGGGYLHFIDTHDTPWCISD